jgi:DNA-binding LacI/PurR family transcriptional regulator
MGLLDVDADSKERHQGFVTAMRDAGLDPKDAVFNSFSRESDVSVGVNALLDARPRFTAVLCVDPTKAELVEKMAKERGLRIPKDLSLVMMQAKVPSGMRISGPCVDFMQLGKAAVHLLKQPARPVQRVRIPTEWFEGETIGPAPD